MSYTWKIHAKERKKRLERLKEETCSKGDPREIKIETVVVRRGESLSKAMENVEIGRSSVIVRYETGDSTWNILTDLSTLSSETRRSIIDIEGNVALFAQDEVEVPTISKILGSYNEKISWTIIVYSRVCPPRCPWDSEGLEPLSRERHMSGTSVLTHVPLVGKVLHLPVDHPRHKLRLLHHPIL